MLIVNECAFNFFGILGSAIFKHNHNLSSVIKRVIMFSKMISIFNLTLEF